MGTIISTTKTRPVVEVEVGDEYRVELTVWDDAGSGWVPLAPEDAIAVADALRASAEEAITKQRQDQVDPAPHGADQDPYVWVVNEAGEGGVFDRIRDRIVWFGESDLWLKQERADLIAHAASAPYIWQPADARGPFEVAS